MSADARVGAPPAPDPARAECLRLARRLREVREDLERRSVADGPFAPSVKALRRVEARLTRLPRLAIAGEFNAGKSSLANVLIGGETLPTAALPNTRLPTLLRYDSRPGVVASLANGERRVLLGSSIEAMWDIKALDVGLSAAALRDLDILDIPGLSDPRLPETGYRAALARSDVIFWCSNSIQAWRESEREAWMALPPKVRSRGVLVVTRRDLLKRADDVHDIEDRLRSEALPAFRAMRFVSSLWAIGASRPAGEGEAQATLDASGLESLRSLLGELLAESQARTLARAKRVAGRIGSHALARLERHPLAQAAY